MSKFTRSGSYSSLVDRKRQIASSRLAITSRSRLSLKAWLPTKAMRLTSVAAPSLISNTTSTRFWSSRMIFGSTVAAKRPALA